MSRYFIYIYTYICKAIRAKVVKFYNSNILHSLTAFINALKNVQIIDYFVLYTCYNWDIFEI